MPAIIIAGVQVKAGGGVKFALTCRSTSPLLPSLAWKVMLMPTWSYPPCATSTSRHQAEAGEA
ncbi:MAG: hypothetical protein ABSF99_13365 [Anaerolineales bacterium]